MDPGMFEGRRRRTQTLDALADVARRVSAGDFAHRVPPPPDDELRPAVAAFNAMVDDLARTRRQLVQRAMHDPLTGLPNRTLFTDRVAHALARTRGRRARTAVAVLFIDLDGFKLVNDVHGHAAGDALLVAITGRLETTLRPHDTVARFGGDEFAILLDDLHRVADAHLVADRLIAAVGEPVAVDGALLHVGASIGIAATRPGEPADPDELLRQADAAMYTAKSGGKGRHRTFEGGLADAAAERASLEGDLRGALDGGALALAYEPVVDLATRRTVALQARLVWHHPERGVVPEARLRALADQTGLAVPLGRWALEQACRHVADLAGLGAGRLALWIALPARLVLDANCPADVAAALRSGGLAPRDLVVGVPEAVLTNDRAPVGEVLGDLAALGVHLAVDGFGSGTAGLSHLRQVPFAVLRLDPGMLIAGPESTLVRAAVAMGRALGLEVAADGVERGAQVAALEALGCALGQGPLFGPPLAHPAMAAQLAEAASATSPARASGS
jgi:diguanylate cyclase (GGDEF)-like protein